MKKIAAAVALFAMLNLFAATTAFAQGKVDLTGTWEGPTWVSGPDIELVLTLVLEHKGEAITGKFSDDMGYINCEITDVVFNDNVLKFNAVANTPDGDIGMAIEMNVTGNKMEGSWEAEGGLAGDWTAEKK